MILQSLLLATVVSAGSKWTYSDQGAWGGQCKTSQKQSPINIVTGSTTNKNPKDDAIKADSFVAGNLGGKHKVMLNDVTSKDTHAIKWTFVKPLPGNDDLKCVQYHCHHDESEHAVNGKKYFGECHVVCMKAAFADLTSAVASKDTDALAVFGFIFDKGNATTNDHPVIAQMINSKKNYVASAEIDIEIPVTAALDQGYYRYTGGLTTPGCNEVVTWTVFKDIQKISSAQYNEIKSWTDGNLRGNDRKLQKLNGRKITFYKASAAKMMVSFALILLMFIL